MQIKRWIEVPHPPKYGRFFYSSSSGQIMQIDDPEIVIWSIKLALIDFGEILKNKSGHESTTMNCSPDKYDTIINLHRAVASIPDNIRKRSTESRVMQCFSMRIGASVIQFTFEESTTIRNEGQQIHLSFSPSRKKPTPYFSRS